MIPDIHLVDGKRHMETTEEYKLLLNYFEQPIEQMEWKYFEEKKLNSLHKASFRLPSALKWYDSYSMNHTMKFIDDSFSKTILSQFDSVWVAKKDKQGRNIH